MSRRSQALRRDILRSVFHLPAEKSRDGLHQLLFGLRQRRAALLQQQHHAPHQIAFGQDRRRNAQKIALQPIADVDAALAVGVAVDLPGLHQPLQFLRAALVHQLPPRRTGYGNDAVAVADHGDMTGVLADGVADLRRKIGQVSHRRVFFKNDLSILLRVDLQRVALADTQRPADLLGDHDAAKVV